MKMWAKRLNMLFVNARETYRDIEKATGIPRSALQRYFTGECAKIPLDRIELLAKHYGVSAEFIVGWEHVSEGDLVNMHSKLASSPASLRLMALLKDTSEEELEAIARAIEEHRKR